MLIEPLYLFFDLQRILAIGLSRINYHELMDHLKDIFNY
jgi:hypothetical protein